MKHLNLKYGTWMKDEIERLKSLYPDVRTQIIANVLGRPVQNVKKKASRMHLTKSPKYLRRVLHRSR